MNKTKTMWHTLLQHLLYRRSLELNPQYLQDVCLHRVLNIFLVWEALWTLHKFKIHGSSVHGDSPGKNSGVGCHALLQGIFPTQGLNLGLLHCRWFLYHLSHQGSPPYMPSWNFLWMLLFKNVCEIHSCYCIRVESAHFHGCMKSPH